MRGQNSLQSEEQIRFWCPNQDGRGGFLLAKAPAGNVAEQGREAMSKGDGGPWGQGSPTHSESPNNCSSSLDSVLSRTWTHWIQRTLWFNPTASELVGIKKKNNQSDLRLQKNLVSWLLKVLGFFLNLIQVHLDLHPEFYFSPHGPWTPQIHSALLWQ